MTVAGAPTTGRVPGLLRVMHPYLRQVAGLLTVGSLAGIVMNVAVVLPAVLLGRAIDTALALDRGAATRADLGRAVLLLIAGTLLTEIPRIGKRWWLGVARARVRATVRADAMRGVLGWSAERQHRTAVGEIVARIIGDVEVLGTGIGEIIVETWDTLLFSASLVVAMCLYDLRLAALALAPVPLALLLAKASGRWVAGRTVAARRANAALTVFISERLTGLRVVRAFGRAGATADTVSELAGAQADAELATTRLSAGLQPVYAVLTTCGVVAVVWVGGDRVAAGALSVGGLVAFLQLFVRFTTRAFRIPQMANRVQAGRSAYGRLEPLLAPPVRAGRRASWRTGEIPGPPVERPTGAAVAAGPVAVALRDVEFRYPGASVAALRGVDLDVPPGALVAVTGPVASGKSALAAAVAGLYPPLTGSVRVDGTDPYAWTTDERAVLGYLPQGHPVFSGTVAGNIALAYPEPVEAGARVTGAAETAGLDDDLAGWPDGMGTHIGEMGVRVSGGQRQRIALARALAAPRRAPRLLVLDDPFSAVDVVTESRVVAALRAYAGPGAPDDRRATIILCSTRLAAFPLADLVVVLDAGRVVERGRHDELLAAGGLYARIYRAQQRTHGSATVPS